MITLIDFKKHFVKLGDGSLVRTNENLTEYELAEKINEIIEVSNRLEQKSKSGECPID